MDEIVKMVPINEIYKLRVHMFSVMTADSENLCNYLIINIFKKNFYVISGH